MGLGGSIISAAKYSKLGRSGSGIFIRGEYVMALKRCSRR
jgi:hypothetical protein